ncbi:hypothetical protein BAUCODRAFT_340532 [Baudoinia panamericana UAMH 10762]|uniref:C6 transcription factor RegA n=1 Tax=Baudoinia panamericana (strain UAMH 10762) TaxID=717646 RepID=M2NJG7_BAUPA|nr:uncharacterized protein BAUCODRAFT_340532 [Baudoinia panamericana UAMH 10762]EMC99529.1 hypothetical protein BAUCODRAFT_340532 [Baudoinia panamericana UAMH 10762]
MAGAAQTGLMRALSASDGESGAADARHQCYICSRTYERQDHLSRHLRSHENERSYRCPDCGKGFNRADLLNRHRAAHTKNAGEVLRRRTGRACLACIRAKTKCDEQRPCKRCKTRGTPCEESENRKHSVFQTGLGAAMEQAPPLAESPDYTETRVGSSGLTDQSSQQPISSAAFALGDSGVSDVFSGAGQCTTPRSSAAHFEDASLLLGLNASNTGGTTLAQYDGEPNDLLPVEAGATGLPFSDFFEQIMMPDMDLSQHHPTIFPPDVSHFTSDLNFDVLDYDFSFLAHGLTRPPTPQGLEGEEYSSTGSGKHTVHSDAHLRSEAFRRNPWSWNDWIPERNSHVFADQGTLDVHHERVNTTHQLTSPESVRLHHCELTNPARDRMIRVVTQVAQSRLAISSFPSLELLEDLIDIYLLQDSSAADSYIHSASFAPMKTRTELLLAIVAAGARFIALKEVWRMGLVFQEVVRLGLAELLESDNTATRELQVLQALLLILDIGVWSGFRRKTEIAISFLGPPVTMMTWSKLLMRFGYLDIVPCAHDTDLELQEKWQAWAEREAKKRLVLHTFLHDSQVSMVNMKNPLISPAQLMMPLPACRELWLAPNAHAWRHAYLRLKPTTQAELPTMMDFFGDNKILEHFDEVVDKPLCLLAACHGLGHEVWQYRCQERLLANRQSHSRRDRWLDHKRTQRDLSDDLSALHAYCDVQTNGMSEIMLTIDMLMMSLHVDLEDIQTFSGKLGEDEARRVYPKLLAWSQDTESRTAVWHAGQVFRLARKLEKTRLRDFSAVALYHSTLTLWVYGMVTSNTARKNGVKTPADTQPRTTHADDINNSNTLIDTDDERAAKTFVLLGKGVPGIQDSVHSFVPLANPKGLMLTAEAVLKGNFHDSRNGLPPLVENLAKLMNELANLSG